MQSDQASRLESHPGSAGVACPLCAHLGHSLALGGFSEADVGSSLTKGLVLTTSGPSLKPIELPLVIASIGAGNASEDRVANFRLVWDEATQGTGPSRAGPLKPRQVYNGLHAHLALAWGRPSIFSHLVRSLWSALPWVPDDVALFDNAPCSAR